MDYSRKFLNDFGINQIKVSGKAKENKLLLMTSFRRIILKKHYWLESVVFRLFLMLELAVADSLSYLPSGVFT